MESQFDCTKCETQGTCLESQVMLKPFACVTHRFIRQDMTETKERSMKLNWTCEHCGLAMSLQLNGAYAGIILFGSQV